jgi:thiol-disulfide isomerase/thioredoxin
VAPVFNRWFIALTTLLIASSAVWAAPQIGEKAPKVKAAKWMTSAPPALPGEKDADKSIFLVEFWATWCGPCRQSIPHLADLHRKLAKDGVVIIGVSNEDADTIDKFLKKKTGGITGGKTGGTTIDMPYHVAADDDNATSEKWMAEISGIPHAFLVDKTNTVVWSGHPMSPEMEVALKQVMAGKYDVQTAKNAAVSAKKYEELMAQAQQAAEQKDGEKLFKIIDQMTAVKPQEVMPYLMKRHFLGEFNRAAEIPSLDEKLEAAMKDSMEGLKQIVDFQLDLPLSRRNAGLLYRTVNRANEIAKGRDAQVLGLLARVQCEIGALDGAIETMDRAVGLAAEADRDEFKKTLQYFKDAKQLATKVKS